MSADLLEQPVLGSRRLSNVLVALMVSIGGLGFLLASLSSYLGRDLLPLGHPAALIFVPQGLVMGLYSLAAALLATYLWWVIAVDVGAGTNRFDRSAGLVTISRRGFRKPINVEIPLKDVKAVKVEVRDGLNTRRRISLRVQGRRDLGGMVAIVIDQEGSTRGKDDIPHDRESSSYPFKCGNTCADGVIGQA